MSDLSSSLQPPLVVTPFVSPYIRGSKRVGGVGGSKESRTGTGEIKSRPPYFPMMIDLQGLEVLIVGGGNIAARRADTLLRCGARVIVVAPEIRCEGSVLVHREFQPEDITENISLVIAATNSREVNRFVHDTARAKDVPVNVCDCQAECDFFFPSLINCGNVAASVSTAGISSKLTRKLSDKLREVWASWVNEEK